MLGRKGEARAVEAYLFDNQCLNFPVILEKIAETASWPHVIQYRLVAKLAWWLAEGWYIVFDSLSVPPCATCTLLQKQKFCGLSDNFFFLQAKSI